MRGPLRIDVTARQQSSKQPDSTGTEDPARQVTAAAEAILSEGVANLWDIVEMKGAGHWVQQEAPEAVNHALLDFISTV